MSGLEAGPFSLAPGPRHLWPIAASLTCWGSAGSEHKAQLVRLSLKALRKWDNTRRVAALELVSGSADVVKPRQGTVLASFDRSS